jgi:foldase protein PrsA
LKTSLIKARLSTKKVVSFALLLCVAAAGAGLVVIVQYLSGTVALVNGQRITKSMLYNVMYGQVGSASLDQMITKLLVLQEARSKGLTVTDDEVRAAVNEVIDEQRGADAFVSALQYYGLTRQDFEDQETVYLTCKKVLSPTITVADEDIQAYFDENRDELGQKESINLRQIVTATKDEAQAVLEQLQTGSDFAQLASEKSTDVETSEGGGEMGWIERGTVAPELGQAAFSLSAGSLGGPVETSDGFVVFQVKERKDAKVVTLEEVKDKVKELVVDQKVGDALSGWIDQLRGKARITYRANS